jgi:hypothetical protein
VGHPKKERKLLANNVMLKKRLAENYGDMSKVKVNLKWGKENYNDVEVDLQEPPLVFKSQIFALTSVPPDR